VTATIIGAAMLAGAPIKLSTPVYQVMNGGSFPAGLESRKRAMTLEHLMTMSSGYFCDDNNDQAPGNENGMWDQEEEPDFYKFALKLPMAFDPGEKAIWPLAFWVARLANRRCICSTVSLQGHSAFAITRGLWTAHEILMAAVAWP
jgi:hypothetical protein